MSEGVRVARGDAGSAVVEGKVVDRLPRCRACGRILGEYLGRPWSLKCQKCNAQAKSAPSAS